MDISVCKCATGFPLMDDLARSHYPNLLSHEYRSRFPAHQKISGDVLPLRASNEGLLRPRVARALTGI